MPFAAPLALLGLLFVPLIVAFYLLKLRRDEHAVSSTLLWSRLMLDVEANAPWQKLRRTLLLLLQLLLAIVLVLLAARPFLERPATLARDLVVVVDASASMAATDVSPDRLAVAKDQVLAALADLPAGGSVTVIAAGRTARIVASAATDLARVRQAVSSIRAEPAAGDLADALQLASAIASRSGDGQVLVATDAAGSLPANVRIDVPVRVLAVGNDRRNLAIVAMAVRSSASSVGRSVFISVANVDQRMADAHLELWGDGRLVEARQLTLDPVARADVRIDDIPLDVRVVEARLTGGDELASDDRAWGIVPAERVHRILIVGPGDPYLQSAITNLPDTELYGIPLAEYGPTTHPEKFDLVIFEGVLPAKLPDVPILAIAPTASSALGEVTGTLDQPGLGTLDPSEPLLRFVDLATLHVAQATALKTPDWARVVIPGQAGAPLLYAGDRDGRPAAVLAFEPRRSDLPLQVAFPILVSNLLGELLGASSTPADAIAPGAPVSLAVPGNAAGLRVTKPDGSTVELSPATRGAGSVVFSGTDELGVYTVAPFGGSPVAEASPSSAVLPSPVPTAPASGSASGSPSGSASAATEPAPTYPMRFAVDLFDTSESNITPGPPASLERLGTAPSAGGSGPERPGTATPSTRPPARQELWGPLAVLVLALLTLEWIVYEREALVRWRRSLRAIGGPGQLGRLWRVRRPPGNPGSRVP